MKSFKIVIVISTLLFTYQIISQTLYKGWDIYTSMRDVRSIDIAGNTVWAATAGGLFTFTVPDAGNMKKFTLLNGLSTDELSAVEIDNNGNVYIGGENGAIDVYYPQQKIWKYVNDIEKSNETQKRINHFFIYGNSLFIATEYGISNFNINSFGFVDQPYITLGPDIAAKTPVNEVYVVNDTIWAATRAGIAYANINTSLPIQTNWKDFTIYNSPLISGLTYSITYFDNKVFIGTDSSMVYYENGQLQRYIPSYNGVPLTYPVLKMTVKNGFFYFATGGNDNKIYRVPSGNIWSVELVKSDITVTSLKVTDNHEILAATRYDGVRFNDNNIIPNGPYTNLFFEMSIDWDGNLWAASGSQGFYKYDNNSWTNFTADKYPVLQNNNFKHILASKFSHTIWAGNFGSGLLKITADSMKMYDETNSVLLPLQGSTDFVVLEGLAEDPQGRLWAINRGTSKPIVNFTDQVSYPPVESPQQTTYINMAIDNYGTKWFTFPSDVIGSERGIAYFNEAANSQKIIRGSDLGQDISNANDVIVDNNGEVWIATDNGVVIIADPYQVISTPNSIPFRTKMRIIENGLATPLTENVLSLEKDALNNKWLGTFANGVIYVSSDGSTILSQFNTSNSPLPDNSIVAISVNPVTGKAYFGTQKGAASYETIAVQPLDECDVIKVGPNPFIIPNDSKLRIDGLVQGSFIKILSISGTLISEFESPGGRIGTWDGKDSKGNYVPTGIYIIVGYNKDGSKVCTGKVAVIRK